MDEIDELATARYRALIELNALRVGSGNAPSAELIAFALEAKACTQRGANALLGIAGAPIRKLKLSNQVWLADLIPHWRSHSGLRALLEGVSLKEVAKAQKAEAQKRSALQTEAKKNPPTKEAEERRSRLAAVREVVQTYWPRHWSTLEAELGAVASLALKDITQGLALLVVGESGEGKGTTLEMFEGAEDTISIEKLSPAALLSGYAGDGSLSKNDIEDRALFRICKHKVLITTDLAAIFRGGSPESQKDLCNRIPTWMDGRGMSDATGTHGIIGEKGDFSFVWLGGTTPFQLPTWEMMATVGPRLLFLRIPKWREGEPIIRPKEYVIAKRRCAEVLKPYVEWLLSRYERRSMDWPEASPQVEARIARLSELIAFGQAYIPKGGDDPVRPTPNHLEQRLAILLSGVAFVRGEAAVGEHELQLARKVVSSNTPKLRGRVLLSLDEGHDTIPKIVANTGLSQPYVFNILTELSKLKIVHEEGKITTGEVGRPASRWAFSEALPDPWAFDV